MNAGTVEFIFDTDTDKYYFMEMNTRLQVEHPVTEMITGLDLVEWQIRVAAGQTLPITEQSKVPLRGHSLEARIYAEDPDQGFLPQSGVLSVLREPQQTPGVVRIDSGVRQGDEITTFYDPMISKLIVHAPSRSRAIETLDEALASYTVVGVPTNIKFLRRALAIEEFRRGDITTAFIEEHYDELLKEARRLSIYRKGTVAIVKVFLETLKMRAKRRSHLDPWERRDMFRINHRAMRPLTLVDGRDEGNELPVYVEYLKENTFNAYHKDESGFLTSILLNAEIEVHPERPDDLIVRTESETYKVDYYFGKDDMVSQVDYEGSPLNIVSTMLLVNTHCFVIVCQAQEVGHGGRCGAGCRRQSQLRRQPNAWPRREGVRSARRRCEEGVESGGGGVDEDGVLREGDPRGCGRRGKDSRGRYRLDEARAGLL